MWDIPSAAGIVHDVRFSPDGKLVASVSADGTARLWSDDLPKDPAALRAWLDAATPDTVELQGQTHDAQSR